MTTSPEGDARRIPGEQSHASTHSVAGKIERDFAISSVIQLCRPCLHCIATAIRSPYNNLGPFDHEVS